MEKKNKRERKTKKKLLTINEFSMNKKKSDFIYTAELFQPKAFLIPVSRRKTNIIQSQEDILFDTKANTQNFFDVLIN